MSDEKFDAIVVGAGVAAIGLDPASRIGGSVQFFVYDVIKIFILLSVLIFAISYVQSHFPPERTRAMLQTAPAIASLPDDFKLAHMCAATLDLYCRIAAPAVSTVPAAVAP